MPRKKKKTEEGVTTEKVVPLVPIAELLKTTSILGERSGGKLPRNAEFSPAFLEMATRLVAAGLTEPDLAYILGTTIARIKYWKRNNPLFKKACTDGKSVAKSYMIAQGLKAAAGYDIVEKNVKIKHKMLDDGTLVEYPAEISEFHKHVKPDSALLIFMLANLSRQMKDEVPWTSQHKIEVDQNKNISIKISGKVASDQIDRLAGAFNAAPIIEADFNEANNNNTEGPGKLTSGDTETSDQ